MAGSAFAGGIYFYWRLSDRRVTDIDERQQWFKENYEGDQIHGELLTAKIGSVRCRSPNTFIGKLKRYLLQDVGRTEVNLLFEGTEIGETVWKVVEEKIEDRGVRVVSQEFKKSTRSSFIKIEIPSIDSETVEEEMKYPLIYVDTCFEEKQKGNL
jgi:hypothetical protein